MYGLGASVSVESLHALRTMMPTIVRVFTGARRRPVGCEGINTPLKEARNPENLLAGYVRGHAVDWTELEGLLRDAWRMTAPKKLVAKLEEN